MEIKKKKNCSMLNVTAVTHFTVKTKLWNVTLN